MLHRRYTSIAEEPESGETSLPEERNIKETTDDKNLSFTKTRNSESSSRQSATSARLSTSELTENTVDESESDRLSLSEDEDLFAEEAENKSQRKDKRATSKQSNSYLHRASKYEEEILKSVKLTPDQIREIKEAFHVFDNNGDGCITATELKKLVTSLGYNITEAELMDMMNQIDADDNGAIDFPEFLALMTKNLEDCDPEDILLESFKVFDRDGSGFIGVTELDRVFKLLGQDFKDYEIEAMIKAADADGDGLVGWEDFTKMMNV